MFSEIQLGIPPLVNEDVWSHVVDFMDISRYFFVHEDVPPWHQHAILHSARYMTKRSNNGTLIKVKKGPAGLLGTAHRLKMPTPDGKILELRFVSSKEDSNKPIPNTTWMKQCWGCGESGNKEELDFDCRQTKEEKAFLPVSGTPLIEKITGQLEPLFNEILISVSNPAPFSHFPFRLVVDGCPNQGPLLGILGGLRESGAGGNFVMACDIPEIHKPFLREMAQRFTGGDYDIVVPVTGKDKYEPLFAFYHRRIIPLIESLLDKGIRKIIELFFLCRVAYIPLENAPWYRNLNTGTDYREYVDSIARQ